MDDVVASTSHFTLDDLNDVGPAGPASASEGGVVMITRTDEIVLAKRSAPLSTSAKPTPGVFQPIERAPSEFFAVARGPAILGAHAYWISHGRLVRKRLDGSAPLEVLAEGARDGTRVAAAALRSGKAVAAFITKPRKEEDVPLARLWIEGGQSLDICPDGAGASSVALSRAGQSLVVAYIDGRSGMTPVHARKLLEEPSAVRLGPDLVIWVAGPAQAGTELTTTGSAAGHWAFVPMERDVSHFGLAQIEVGQEPRMDVPVSWRTYPNGLDLAPVSAAEVCGLPAVGYARPAAASAGSAQSLHLATFGDDTSSGSEVLATARGFANVSLSALPGGAILSYVADRRTWARILRCKPSPAKAPK